MNEDNKQIETTEFDPSTLPAEVQEWFNKEKERYADSRVTGAVKKATERVKSEMANDVTLRETIRKELEFEANLTAEEKIRMEREKVDLELKALKKESNAFLVKKELLTYGFDENAIENLTNLVVSEDKDSTLARLKTLTDTYSSTLTARVEQEKLGLLQKAGANAPASGNVPVSEKAEYKEQFIAAKKANDTAAANRILRESQSKGINIFE